MKKTPWFDGSVKPCADRVGYYERDYGLEDRLDWWDGKLWRYEEGGLGCLFLYPWRGLTKEAK